MEKWENYQKRTYNNDVSKLLEYFCNNYSVKSAVDLGCGSGNESVYLLKKGVKVTSIDNHLNKSFILDRLSEEEAKNVSFIESNFEDVELPKTELLLASFSIPFCNPQKFDELWDKIYDCIEDNGYFVGQLFGNRDAWRRKKDINTFKIEVAKNYLEKYKILKFDEIEYIRESDHKKWHFYNIIAKKEK